MTLAIVADPAPLTVDPDGVVRVTETRITLDTVVAVFRQGATAEEIVPRYPFGKVIEDILMILECGIEKDFEGQIYYLPL
jgi:uncharacterized protein (DUF433 family)